MNKLLPGVLLAAFTTAGVAQVSPSQNQPPASTPGQSQPGGATTFQSLDKNADQKLSKAEAAMDRTLNQSFTALDVNGDGSLTMAEYASHRQGASTPRSDSTVEPTTN